MSRAKLIATLIAFATPSLAFAQPSETPPAPAPVAETPVPIEPPPAAAPAASVDIDLAALGLDPNASTFDDKLNIFGFADVLYNATHFQTKSPLLKNSRNFASGSLDLYVSKNLTAEWRFLAEVRFLYLPNGGTNLDGTTVVATSNDPTNFSRPQSWGGVSIERAYIEYDLAKNLTIRAGRFLTPYGIWNIDHGSPVIIATYRPYIIGEGYIPEHQTGLELFGKKLVGEYTVGYHATVSNGRSPVEANTDPDSSLAFGGRLEVEAPWAGTLKIGASGYAGQYSGVAASVGAPIESYDERSYGVDAKWDHGGIHLQGELLANEHRYRDNQRAKTGAGFAPDGRQWGAYVLAGYRFDRIWNVMPYASYENLHPLDHSVFERVEAYSTGLNFRPSPNVVLKLQYGFIHLHDGFIAGTWAIDTITTQAAWVF